MWHPDSDYFTKTKRGHWWRAAATFAYHIILLLILAAFFGILVRYFLFGQAVERGYYR